MIFFHADGFTKTIQKIFQVVPQDVGVKDDPKSLEIECASLPESDSFEEF